MKESMKEFMNEERLVNKWFVVKVAVWGAFTGALLTAAFLITFGLVFP